MLDTLSPEVVLLDEYGDPIKRSPQNYLAQQYERDKERLTENQIKALQAHRERVWNKLVPASAVAAELKPHYVRYLNPTKGWRYVGKRRFAAYGVL
ncbi:hypothetical protein [Bradyrhizobium sp. BR 10289]|uniref:hypothetical protein n=1 Tax=Bradyrhizobium sp. BR 10289 TaxID=2749993 RepID=UPI001C652BA4|nr:hypothetical protein [Bradyrhizobium sp. BR 10289]MBW7970994.1 hypothetical protein [Bradyrhizobium sp. BR 10289]